MIDFPSIQFPLYFISFNGYEQLNNPNIRKIPSKTGTYDYPEGIVVKVKSSNLPGYAKSFDCYAVKKYQQNGQLYTMDKLVMHMYYYEKRNDWLFYYSGAACTKAIDELEIARKFLIEYAERFKI